MAFRMTESGTVIEETGSYYRRDLYRFQSLLCMTTVKDFDFALYSLISGNSVYKTINY